MKSATLSLIAIAALSCALSAQADSWSMANQAGGNIVLTDRPCSVKGSAPLLESYSFAGDGTRLEGCWGAWDDMAQVVWLNGKRSAFDFDSFTPTTQSAPVKPVGKPKKLDL